MPPAICVQDRFGRTEAAAGVSYAFTGNYENHVRAEKKLKLIVPSCFS